MKNALVITLALALFAPLAPYIDAYGGHAKPTGHGCPHHAKSEGPVCIAKLADTIQKAVTQDENGNLICTHSGTVFAIAKKENGKTVYKVGDKTYECKWEASEVGFKAKHLGMTGLLDKSRLLLDEEGNILCPYDKQVFAKTKKVSPTSNMGFTISDTGMVYTVEDKDYHCVWDALIAAAPECAKACKMKKDKN